MSFNSIGNRIQIYLTFLFILLSFYSTPVQCKCRRFDVLALGHIDYDRLFGKWNIHYTSDPLMDTNCSKVFYHHKEADSVAFDIFRDSNRNSRGIIINCEEKRKQLTIGISAHTFWILSTDYDNYLLTYQCSKENKEPKEIYRILSRNCVQPLNLDKILHTLKGISNSIQVNEVFQPECEGQQHQYPHSTQYSDSVNRLKDPEPEPIEIRPMIESKPLIQPYEQQSAPDVPPPTNNPDQKNEEPTCAPGELPSEQSVTPDQQPSAPNPQIRPIELPSVTPSPPMPGLNEQTVTPNEEQEQQSRVSQQERPVQVIHGLQSEIQQQIEDMNQKQSNQWSDQKQILSLDSMQPNSVDRPDQPVQPNQQSQLKPTMDTTQPQQDCPTGQSYQHKDQQQIRPIQTIQSIQFIQQPDKAQVESQPNPPSRPNPVPINTVQVIQQPWTSDNEKQAQTNHNIQSIQYIQYNSRGQQIDPKQERDQNEQSMPQVIQQIIEPNQHMQSIQSVQMMTPWSMQSSQQSGHKPGQTIQTFQYSRPQTSQLDESQSTRPKNTMQFIQVGQPMNGYRIMQSSQYGQGQSMQSMQVMQPMKPMKPMEPMKPMQWMKPMQPMRPMRPMGGMRSMGMQSMQMN